MPSLRPLSIHASALSALLVLSAFAASPAIAQDASTATVPQASQPPIQHYLRDFAIKGI